MASSDAVAIRSVLDGARGWKPWNFGKVGDCGCFEPVDMRAGRWKWAYKERMNEAKPRLYGVKSGPIAGWAQ